jgi:cytochrome c-type biogenesis protein CcmH
MMAGRSRGWLVLSVAAVVAGVALAAVAARGPSPPASLADEVREVASTLRCPVCQNLSVADSSSRLAHEMRADIARDLRAGKSPDEIRGEFVAAYGEWILLAPQKTGINWLPWLAPVLLLAFGGAVAAWRIRGWAPGALRGSPALAQRLGPEDRALLDRSLSIDPEDPQ